MTIYKTSQQERECDPEIVEPLVTVITPNYNQADYLEETIISVIEQDYKYFECIVLDDGSTDKSTEILKRYDGRIDWLTHPNMGETRTVNKGISMARGSIIVVINADDPFYNRSAISKAVACFQSNPSTLAVYTDWVTIDEHGQVIKEVRLPQYNIENMLKEFNCALGPSMFISKDALVEIGMRNEKIKYTGDLDISFRLAIVGELTHLPDLLGTHRVHSKAQSSTGQGVTMAREVSALVVNAFLHPNVPQSCLSEKSKILANAYFVASHYCGGARWECIRLLSKSFTSFPSKKIFYLLTREFFRPLKNFLRR